MGRLGGAAWRTAWLMIAIATATGAAAEPLSLDRQPSGRVRGAHDLERRNAETLRGLERLKQDGIGLGMTPRYGAVRPSGKIGAQPFVASVHCDANASPTRHVEHDRGSWVPTSIGRVAYVAVVSSRRTAAPTRFGVQREASAYDVAFTFSPLAVPRLTIGGNVRLDEMDLRDEPSRDHAIRELTESAYIEYVGSHFEALGGIGVAHRDRTSARVIKNLAGYLQLGYRIGAFTPFARLDRRNLLAGDPFVAADGLDLDDWEHVVGVRYELSRHLAFKLEGAGGRTQRLSVGGNAMTETFGRVAVQFAWLF